MDSGNLNCWFKSVFFVLGYSTIFHEYKKYYVSIFLSDKKMLNSKILKQMPAPYKLLNDLVKDNNVYDLQHYKDDTKKYYKTNIPKLNAITSDVAQSRQLIVVNSNGNFANNLAKYATICQDLPYFELYIIQFLKYYSGLKVVDLLYLQSSKSKSIDDVYYYFHKYYNYNENQIYTDTTYKNNIAKQRFDVKEFFKYYFFKNHLYFFEHKSSDMPVILLDMLVVSHYKYNSKLTKYYTELSKVPNNNLLKYSNEIKNKQPSNITHKVLLLNIINDSKEPIIYYSKKNGKTIITTTHICGTDIDLNKEFLLFGCLLRNNNSEERTKTIFAYLTYDTPEYKYEIKDDEPKTPVKVSYSINCQNYIDDTIESKIVDFDWISHSSNFKDETFIITENGFDYEYNFATGDKLLLYMNVFSLIFDKIFDIQLELSTKFPDYRLQHSTVFNDEKEDQPVQFSSSSNSSKSNSSHSNSS